MNLLADRDFLRDGCPQTAGYLLYWAHLFWALDVALSGGPAVRLYTHLPLVEAHLWDGLAVVAAVLLRVGIGHLRDEGDARALQVGAGLGFVLWAWADVAFFVQLGASSALVYTALADGALWVVYLTGNAWVR